MNEEITMRVSAHRGSRSRGQTATVVDNQPQKKSGQGNGKGRKPRKCARYIIMELSSL